MGNRQATSNTSAEADEGGPGESCEEDAALVAQMRRVMERDSVRLFDEESGLHRSVPFIEAVENSTLFNRRKALTECSLQSTSAGSGRRPARPRGPRRRVPARRPGPQVPAPHYLEDLESPSLLRDMLEFSFSYSLSRLNY